MSSSSSRKRAAVSSDMRNFFPTTKKRSTRSTTTTRDASFAQHLASQLSSEPVYLTETSWYILAKGWMPPPSAQRFQQEWNLHPKHRHSLKLFGRTVQENRYSQSWGMSYRYSGAISVARPSEESDMVQLLLKEANKLTTFIQTEDDTCPYNTCLQNWYEPNHTIGLHADDETIMRKEYPIFSLSWGGTRRFLFRARRRQTTRQTTEVWLEDGDLLVMGGTCQETHQHEVPKRRVTMDPPTSNRINWTIRAFHDDTTLSMDGRKREENSSDIGNK